MVKTLIQSISSDKKYIGLLVIFAMLFLFLTSQMSPLYPTNDWADVNVYFNIGKAMMNGRTLYTEAFDHKGPLIFVIYAIGYLFSNSSFLGMFIIQWISWCVMLIAIFKTSKIYLSDEFSFLVAIISPLLFLQYTHTGGSAEEFILVMSTISLYFFYRYFNQTQLNEHNPKWMLLHSLLATAVFMVKLNLVIFWVFPTIAIFVYLLYTRKYKNFAYNALYAFIGIIIVALPICLYLLMNGALAKAYEVYILLNKQYADPLALPQTLAHTASRVYKLFMSEPLGAVLSFVGAFYFPIRYIKSNIGRIGMILCSLSLFVIIFSPRTFHFYYPLSFYVFVIPGLISIGLSVQQYIDIRYSRKMLSIFMLSAVLIGIHSKNFFSWGGDILIGSSKPHSPNFQFAEIISQSQHPSLLNLGFGYGNNMFTLCNIVPNEQYFLSPNIPHGMYPDMRNEQTRYLENRTVEYVVFDNFSFNYEYFKDLPALHDNYELIDTFVNKKLVFKDVFSTYYLYHKKSDLF